MPTESPWLLVAIGGGILLVALLRVLPRTAIGGGLLALLAAAMIAGGFVIDALVVTDREAIDERLGLLVATFAANDAPGVQSFIAPGEVALRLKAATGVRLVDVAPGYRLTDIRTSVDEASASQQFRLNGEFSYLGTAVSHRPTMWRLTWQRIGDAWLIADVAQLDPISGEQTNQFDQLR